VIRIHLTPADLAHVRFAGRPAPLQELHAALLMLFTPRNAPLLFGRWRTRTLRALPTAAAPLRDLAPAGQAPAFLDTMEASLDEALDTMRASDPAWIAAELELAYASAPNTPPAWLRDLHSGAREAWQPVLCGERAAFDRLLAPVWPLVQDLHRTELARYAAIVAHHGLGRALTSTVHGSRLHDGTWTWELPAIASTATREVHTAGRGVVLLPTFHWTGRPLIADTPGRPVTVTFPAGPGLPLPSSTATSTEDALSDVLGRTRFRILTLSGGGLNTSALARKLDLSAATVSAHTTALRAAGLITSTRDGKAVVHHRTALAGLLLGAPHHPDQPGADTDSQRSFENDTVSKNP
jgi:DNA-binding transcriptional ArsR family regulator